MEENKNKAKTVLTTEIGQQQNVENRQDIKQLIIQLADEKVESKFLDPNLDRQNEKIKLLNGSEITLKQIREQQTLIAKRISVYAPSFRSEFYSEINRLNGWNIPEERIHQKPPIVGRFTNEIIYGRFPKEVLPTLQHLNPYVGFGTRVNKHFQWLTSEGKGRLEGFIEDSIRVMKTCATWYDFRIKYTEIYGVPFQLSLFPQ